MKRAGGGWTSENRPLKLTNYEKRKSTVKVGLKSLKNDRNDGPAWINISDLIGFTYKMKNIKVETDTLRMCFRKVYYI